MTHAHLASVLLFCGTLVCLVGSHKLEVSLSDSDLLSPVTDATVAYDWQALDQRLESLPDYRIASNRGDNPSPRVRHTALEGKTPVKTAQAAPQATPAVSLVLADRTGNTSVPSREEIEDYVEKVFGKHATNAKRVISCESSWNPSAVNRSNRDGSNDKGLWQINSIHGLSDACRLDYKCSTDFAYKLFKRSGWQPWYSSRKCHGLK